MCFQISNIFAASQWSVWASFMIPDGLLTPLRTIKLAESKVDLKELQYSVYPKFSSAYSESWWSRVIRLQSAKTWHVWLYSICSSVVFQLFLSLRSFSHWNLLERFFSPLLPKTLLSVCDLIWFFNIRWTYSALPGIVIIQTRSNIDCVPIPPFPRLQVFILIL